MSVQPRGKVKPNLTRAAIALKNLKKKKKIAPQVIGTAGKQPTKAKFERNDHPFNEYEIDVTHMSFQEAHAMTVDLMKRGRCRAWLYCEV